MSIFEKAFDGKPVENFTKRIRAATRVLEYADSVDDCQLLLVALSDLESGPNVIAGVLVRLADTGILTVPTEDQTELVIRYRDLLRKHGATFQLEDLADNVNKAFIERGK